MLPVVLCGPATGRVIGADLDNGADLDHYADLDQRC